MKFGCVVLAAGRSVRFGESKLVKELCGVPVLQRTLSALPGELFAVRVAVTSDPAAERLCRNAGFPAVRYPGGPVSESIRAGMARMAGTDACLFVNGDQPLLRTESIRGILKLSGMEPDAVIRLSWDGKGASPVLFPCKAYPLLNALEGENGGRQVIRSGMFRVLNAGAGSAAELLDVDTPELLAEAERMMTGKGI